MQSSDHTNPKLSFNVEEREGKRPRVDVDPFFEASASTVLDPTHRPDRLQLQSRLYLSFFPLPFRHLEIPLELGIPSTFSTLHIDPPLPSLPPFP